MLILQHVFLGGRPPVPMACAQGEPDVFARLAALEARMVAVEGRTPSEDEKKVLRHLDFAQPNGKPTINVKADLQVRPEDAGTFEIKALSSGDKDVLSHFEVKDVQSIDMPNAITVVRFTGNFQIVNGNGPDADAFECDEHLRPVVDPETGEEVIPTFEGPNGLGNLILGYAPFWPRGDHAADHTGFAFHSGSHNLVVGQAASFTGEGCFIGGRYNEAHESFSIVGGVFNLVGPNAFEIDRGEQTGTFPGANAILSGTGNTIRGHANAIVAGISNRISGSAGSVIVGGGREYDDHGYLYANTILGAPVSVIVGGNGGKIEVTDWEWDHTNNGIVLLLGDGEGNTSIRQMGEGPYGLFETDAE